MNTRRWPCSPRKSSTTARPSCWHRPQQRRWLTSVPTSRMSLSVMERCRHSMGTGSSGRFDRNCPRNPSKYQRCHSTHRQLCLTETGRIKAYGDLAFQSRCHSGIWSPFFPDLQTRYIARLERIMIDNILPAAVVCVERVGEPKSKDFELGRECALKARQTLGSPIFTLPKGANGEPLWPEGVVGSITHTFEYCAAAVSWANQVGKLGIDAEAHRSLNDGVVEIIANADEVEM